MLCFSQTTGYAVLALSCLEIEEVRWTLAKDLVAATGIPGPYLWKIMHMLGKTGFIKTKRGYQGGYALKNPADRISLFEVVEAIEGRDWMNRCLLGFAECSDERACPAHEFWKSERRDVESKLRAITLAEVAAFEKKQGKIRIALNNA